MVQLGKQHAIGPHIEKRVKLFDLVTKSQHIS